MTNILLTLPKQTFVFVHLSCGLVALAMGMNMLHEMTVKDRVKTLLEAAVELQITKKGEMFSGLYFCDYVSVSGCY